MDKETLSLEEASRDYLLWMISEGYTHSTWAIHEKALNQFIHFVKQNELLWDDIFTSKTVDDFLKDTTASSAAAIRGLWRFLFHQRRIQKPLNKPTDPLADIYEDYLRYYETTREASNNQMKHIRRVLLAFHDYLEKNEIPLSSIKIEHLDAFQAEFNQSFKPTTSKTYRSYLRGFLSYLCNKRKILHRDLAPFVVGAPIFDQGKPPKFLRPHELQRLFDSLDISSVNNLRTYAMVHLAYSLGLRPMEISSIHLDDISFRKGLLTLKNRKNNQPLVLPLPDSTIKAIAAYIIAERPKSKHRRLFLTRIAPYHPITPGGITSSIRRAMHKAGLSSSAYWLRHTYAQNLLEAGTSINEIKEMLGHERIDSTQKYLHIHIKLMREVLFDESL